MSFLLNDFRDNIFSISAGGISLLNELKYGCTSALPAHNHAWTKEGARSDLSDSTRHRRMNKVAIPPINAHNILMIADGFSQLLLTNVL